MADLDSIWNSSQGLDSSASAPSQLTWKDRLVLNNFFDTQPKKRAAYLDQLGFEMSPKDDNAFRAKGSSGGYVGKVNPNFSDMASIYDKGGIAAVAKENIQKLGGMAYSTLFPAAMGVAGAGEGALSGNPWVSLGMGISGSVLGAGMSESMKQGIADLMLDKNIPNDYKLQAAQSLMMGVIPKAIEGGLGIKNNIQASTIQKTVDGIKNAAQRFSGGKITPDILKQAAENPQMFSKGAVQNAEQNMAQDYQRMFGIKSPSIEASAPDLPITKRPSEIAANSDFGKALQPLNQAADQVESKLSSDPRANIKVSDVLDAFKQQQQPFHDGGYSEPEDEAGLKLLDKYQNQFIQRLKKSNGNVPVDQLLDQEVPFGEVRQLSKKMKDAVKDVNGENRPGGGLVMQVAGSGPGQLGSLLSDAADNAGSDWSAIQKERHDILDLYNVAKNKLTPNNLQSAFLGNDSIAKSDVQNTLALMDQKFGSNYSQGVQNSNYQRAFKSMYNNGAQTFGSGAVLPELANSIAQEGAKGAALGGSIGAPIGLAWPGAKLGFMVGAAKGVMDFPNYSSMTNPADAFKQAIEKQLQLDNGYKQMVSSPAAKTAMGTIGQVIGPKITPDVSSKPVSLDDIWDQTHGQGGQ